nr:uncharacterized protein LOC129275914 [Lytechinus pictus]
MSTKTDAEGSAGNTATNENAPAIGPGVAPSTAPGTAPGTAPASAVAPAGASTQDIASEAPREKMIETAVKFLLNPQVRSSPMVQKKAFLRKKGKPMMMMVALLELLHFVGGLMYSAPINDMPQKLNRFLRKPAFLLP